MPAVVPGMPRLLCALLLTLPLLAACGGDDTDRPGGDSAPAGTRWVGAAGVVVAVPDWWTTGETQCGAPVEDTVYADAAAQVDCEDPDVPATIQEVAALAVLDATSGYGAEQLRTMVPVAGRPDLVERPGCEQWYDGVCRHLFALRGSDVVLAVTVTDDSGTTWAAVRDSARAVPAGRTTVPISLAGTWASPTWGEPPPAADAMTDALQAAGLRVETVTAEREDDGGDYGSFQPGSLLAVEPAPGTLVADGSTVTLTVSGRSLS